MQSDLSNQADSCANQGNQYPFCSPESTDVWKNGSTHDFIWNYNYPYYVGYEQMSLYLYYMIKFEYVNVKSYLNLDRIDGGLEVTIDDTWFLNKLEPGASDQNLTILGFYLPSTANVTQELASPISMYPRPFNFTVTQTAPPGNGSTSNSPNEGNSNGGNNGNNNSNNNALSSSLPGWAIAVIVLAVIAIICGGTALIWAILVSRRNKRNNKSVPNAGTGHSSSDNNEKHDYRDITSINSQAKINAFRSTDSVPMTTASAAENTSSIGSLTSRRTYDPQPLSPAFDANNKFSSGDAVLLGDMFRNTLGRSTADWNNSVTIGDDEEEELKRRRLGEALLQRQLEEDGTSVKHAGRFTRVKSLADIQKSAVFEQPKY